MARKPRVLIAGGIYHVTCRGNARGKIFKDDQDRRRFLERLALSAETQRVRIYLYCLMANHVHLLVETPRGNLSRFMGSLLTGYTVYFNVRHRRAGHLMQGRYGAQVVEGNEYLLKLSRYIHLNPVRVGTLSLLPLAGQVDELRGYAWSSYPEYTGRRKRSGWLSIDPVLGQMEGVGAGMERAAYGRYVEAGLASTDEEFAEIMRQRGVAIGSSAFVEDIKALHRVEAQKKKSEDMAFRQIQQWSSAEDVERVLAGMMGPVWGLRNRRKMGRSVRSVWAWALQRYSGFTQRAVAERLGVRTGAAVCKLLLGSTGDADTVRWQKIAEELFKG